MSPPSTCIDNGRCEQITVGLQSPAMMSQPLLAATWQLAGIDGLTMSPSLGKKLSLSQMHQHKPTSTGAYSDRTHADGLRQLAQIFPELLPLPLLH